ncbi:hypothetical protein M378DRAFT_183271 [Amanita muscaria Koide BX008]|uniref:Defect at low temperature protein 1 n=1 Tax=Amanita muscaria (strain Koide BX008) TaxID=946122 RepID=A0A0C2TTL5_AMAMK|nr:hypothetical protein M378DRAFT_183271 [Amanita muscaria Koide BX008]
MLLSQRVLGTLSNASYALFVLLITTAIALSCAALLSQAVRTAPNRSWSNNLNAVVIGASYAAVLIASLILCANRRVAVRLRLQRISKAHRIIGKGDAPQSVRKYVTQEYIRACLVSYESLPKNHDVLHGGWGRPGTKYEGIRFKDHLLDTISYIDELAHKVIPSHPPLKPHARMLHHFRFILPLLPLDKDGLTPLHYYDSAIQIARNSSVLLSEQEFELGTAAAKEIMQQ